MFLLSQKPSRNIKQLGSQKYSDDMKIKCFDNMEKMYLTSSKNEGKFSNDKKIQYCMIENIVHTPLPETVSTSSYFFQTKLLLANISLGMQLISDALSINRKTLSNKFGKSFSKRYGLKNNDCYKFYLILQKQKWSSKITPLEIK